VLHARKWWLHSRNKVNVACSRKRSCAMQQASAFTLQAGTHTHTHTQTHTHRRSKWTVVHLASHVFAISLPLSLSLSLSLSRTLCAQSLNAPCLYTKNSPEDGSLDPKHVANYVSIDYICVVFEYINLFYCIAQPDGSCQNKCDFICSTLPKASMLVILVSLCL